jgi:transposase
MVSIRDFRQQDLATQTELRRVAVRLVHAGHSRIEAAEAVGADRHSVSAWVGAVARSGEATLLSGKPGRRPDEHGALSPDQQVRIKHLMTKHSPDQLDLPFALWTREAAGLLIERETGVRLASRSTIGRYLRRWGFTPQRAKKRATERREAAVQTWLDRDDPAIAKRAEAEGAEIHWGEETGVSNQAHDGRSFAPKGQTPVIARPAARLTYAMISTVTNQGTLRFMIYEGALNAFIFLNFLRRLIKDAPCKVFLIVDNLRVHWAKSVTTWLAANSEQIEVFYLPPYAPDHNPDEFMHNDLKQGLARRRIPQDRAALKSGLQSHMRSLQRRPAKVRSFLGTHRPLCRQMPWQMIGHRVRSGNGRPPSLGGECGRPSG